MRSLLALALFAGASAHVSMVYLDGQPGSIRNANGATGNGQASVQTPCGGAQTFGSNGVGVAKDGDPITLSMRYAAGHNGAFRMAFACGAGDGSALEADAATIANCEVEGAASAYGAGAGNGATAIGQQAMTISCTLPLQDNTEPQDCTIGILDQRDWGGCVDVSLVPAQAALPPAPPPAPFVSSAAPYYFSRNGLVDTSAGEVAGIGTFTCCGLSQGRLTVPDHPATDGATVVATFSDDAGATECPATTPDKTTAPPPNTATEMLTGTTITLTTSELGNKLTGTTTLVGQPFEVIIASGELSFTNTGGDQPIICDAGFTANEVPTGGTSGNSTDGDDGFSTFGKVAIGVVIILVIVVAFLCYKKVAGGKRSPKHLAVTNSKGAPPPPGPPPSGSAALPAGWMAAVDPASGHTYYVNQSTGQSTWTNPANGV